MIKLVFCVTLIYLVFTQQTNAVSIITGPIIGLVTTTTARILIEFDTAGSITVILTDPRGAQINSTASTKSSSPVPFIFEGLQPNTTYTVSLEDSSINMTESYFTTLSGESGKLNFAALSCLERKQQSLIEPQADLWTNMLKRIQNNEISYLFQVGDQVYTDHSLGSADPEKPYISCMTILNETSPDQWDTKRDQLLEIIRSEYRKTWNIPSVKEVLAKIPTLTIFDDHEIRDDWGFLPQDIDSNSADYYYGALARQVYYEYQRQLREDVDFNNNFDNITQEYYYLTLNDIGFFFVDYRGVRTWERNYSQIENSQLGLTQLNLLEQVLDPINGTFANLNNFFLMSSLSVVFLPTAFIRIGSLFENDAKESWSYQHGHEQAYLLGLLRNWKIAKSGREVTIISGDVHMGGYTDIYFDEDYAFLQLSASSIASSAPSDLEFRGFDLIKDITELEAPWTYEHHDWTNRFNYGLVINNYINDTATSEYFLIEASAFEIPLIKDVDGESISESDLNKMFDTDS